MTIAWVQYDIIWQDPTENRKLLDEILSKNQQNFDLLVLPEMFDTGFIMEPNKLLDYDFQITIQWMQEVSRKFQCIVMGSIATQENNNWYNRFTIVEADSIQYYDKMHLFSLSGENFQYTAGKETLNFKPAMLPKWNIRPFICYDLRFPSISTHSGEIQLMIYVANWPEPRIDQFDTLLRARAIENQSYVLGVNRIGNDGNKLHYNGHSALVSYNGTTILDSADKQGLFIAEILLDELNNYREKLPFLKDRN